MSISIESLRLKAMERPAGYLEDFMAVGIEVGGYLRLSVEDYAKLCQKYPPQGLGDAIAVVADPIAGALHLGNCGGCDDRRKGLNQALPFR